MRLLFCWELGANFGHLSAIAALQRMLRDTGHNLVFAVADLRAARDLLGDEAELLQAPVWPRFTSRGSRNEIASFADVLVPLGFSDTSVLGPVVDGWLGLLKAIRPDVLICDHSPAAQLAARVAGLPLITLGTGFTQPPLEYEALPPLRTDIAPALPEIALLASANEVLERRGAGPVNLLPELFRADRRIVIGLPELDPYRSFRRELLCAPPGGYSHPLPRGSGSRPSHIFAYLGSELPGLEAKIQVLCDLPYPVEVHVRGGDRFLLEFIRMRGKIAHERPANIHETLARATHVVSQGGAMLASEAFSAGLPHLILPLYRETQLNASLVVRAGAGTQLDPEAPADAFSAGLNLFINDSELNRRSMGLARLLAERRLPDAGDELFAALERIRSTTQLPCPENCAPVV